MQAFSHKNSALKDYLKDQTFKREKEACLMASQANSDHNDKIKLIKAGAPNSAGVIANAELVLWLVGVEEPAIRSKKY